MKSRRHEEGLIRVRRAKHTYFIDMMRRRVWLVGCRWPATRRDGGLGCVPHQVQGRGGGAESSMGLGLDSLLWVASRQQGLHS